MLTLTTYQSGVQSIKVKGHLVTIPESSDILKAGWDMFSKVLRNMCLDSNIYLRWKRTRRGIPICIFSYRPLNPFPKHDTKNA